MSISRITKRKLDDAIQTLDDIINTSNDSPAQPSPKKRPNLSIYKSFNNLFRSSPSNAPTPGRTTLAGTPISGPFALSSKPLYRPDSTSDFLARLSTFKITTYRQKADEVNAVAAAKAGWTNEGKDRLVCANCSASWVLASTQGMNQDAASALTQRHRQSLITAHKEFCPWRKAQCSDSIYRLELKGTTAMAKQVKSRAVGLSPVIQGVSLKHPLTNQQLSSLMEAISAVPFTDKPHQEYSADPATPNLSRTSLQSASPPSLRPMVSDMTALSEAAVILALFGWELSTSQPPLGSIGASFGAGGSSYSRASTPAHASPMPSQRNSTLRSRQSLSLGRASGQQFQQSRVSLARTSSFTKSPPLSLEFGVGSARNTPRKSSGGSVVSLEPSRDDNLMITCELCQRKIGLWAYLPSPPPAAPATNEGQDQAAAGPSNTMDLNSPPVSPTFAPLIWPNVAAAAIALAPPARQLDVVKEHRSFCPYIVKSSTMSVPVFSMPLPSTANGPHPAPSSSSLRRSLSLSLGINPGSPPSSNVSGDSPPVEGWRAVLSIVSRYGSGMRMRRTGSSSTTASFGIQQSATNILGVRTPTVSFAAEGTSPPRPPDVMEVDRDIQPLAPTPEKPPAVEEEYGVEKIVENVKKSREGSRDLLRYVKELLRRGDPATTTTPRSDAASVSDVGGCMPRRHSAGTFRSGRLSSARNSPSRPSSDSMNPHTTPPRPSTSSEVARALPAGAI